MTERPYSYRFVLEYGLTLLVLLLLLAYTYAKFEVVPYTGLFFNLESGEITAVFIEAPLAKSLLVGDRIRQIDETPIETLQKDLRRPVFEGAGPGTELTILVDRGGERVAVNWTIPGFNQPEFVDRLLGVLWYGYLFWLAGAATLVWVRPHDLRWRLMVVFFNLTAVWLASGALSAWHIWLSAVILRVAIWFTLPVYLHLHWVFPRSLGRLPGAIWWALYLTAAVLALLQWIQFLPPDFYFLAFLLAVMGTLGLLVAHVARQPDQRRDAGLLAIAVAVVLIPIMILGLTGLLGEFPALGGWSFLPCRCCRAPIFM